MLFIIFILLTSYSLNSKIFIIGLPRTGTTSLCAALLNWHYQVAHTAYINATFEQADVLADTPIFHDYPLLDVIYPNSRFIYLIRSFDSWLPSIRQLLTRMLVNLNRDDGGFNPIIKRVYGAVFGDLTADKIADDAYLFACYHQHQQQVETYFQTRCNDLLTLDISEVDSYQRLAAFLHQPILVDRFEHHNRAGKVTAWKDIKHLGKVASTNNGRAEALFYLTDK